MSVALLQSRFGFSSFRPYQEAVCEAATLGRDVLLVMPTGAGKSLCYQLPGLARGGTTLVVSPLIALMEDQVAKLLERGIRADRIHSGRGRDASRAACRAYLDGALDFLFIAPERLRVPGFPEMLARRRLALVAIDEAHCISQWGHDFRPEYRMLGERLPQLRPAPFMALTATATPRVQDDIVDQLRLHEGLRFIHGFRRTNIAVEVVEKSPSARAESVVALLADAARRPAIVYAPTRRESESLGELLASERRAVSYHAGMTAYERTSAQERFLGGAADIVVATTAFGMGIDKANVRTVIHTALPATLEGYYQEIGRAGRDGAPSRAVLFHSFADSKTHEFFHERDYPSRASLDSIFEKLSDRPVLKEALQASCELDAQVFEKALEKLWLHGGARIDPDELIRRGEPAYQSSYDKQVAHRLEQMACARRYAERSKCRMLQLVAHFGDEQDSGAPCGECDICAPDRCIAQSHRGPSKAEQEAARLILASLAHRDGQTVGQIHRDLFASGTFDRRSLEHVLGGLARAKLLRLEEDSFVKDGTTIAFQRVHATGVATAGTSGFTSSFPMTADARRAHRAKKGKSKVRALPPTVTDDAPVHHAALFEALRAWRVTEARKAGLPAFRILNDRTLLGVATHAPADEGALLQVSGVGPSVMRRYGPALLDIVARHCGREA
jgi:DNA topoisomerase-3